MSDDNHRSRRSPDDHYRLPHQRRFIVLVSFARRVSASWIAGHSWSRSCSCSSSPSSTCTRFRPPATTSCWSGCWPPSALALGVLGGFATHVRVGSDGVALARVGWIAGALLIAGISSRMVFVFAVHHGAEPAIRSFSIAHHIGAAAWPVALVSMALIEVTARLVTVQLRGRRLQAPAGHGTIAVPAAA